jgi:hypothetical protein
MRFLILTFLVCQISLASLYVGGGVEYHHSSYSANNINTGDASQNLPNVNSMFQNTFISYNGTKEAFKQDLKTSYPKGSIGINTIINQPNNTFGGCMQNGIIIGSPNWSGVCSSGTPVSPSVEQIMQDFGSSVLHKMKGSYTGLSTNFQNLEQKKEFEQKLGYAIFTKVLGFSNFTDAQLMEFFKTGDIAGMTTIKKPNIFQISGDSLVTLATKPLANNDDKNETNLATWNSITDAIIETFLNDPSINYLPVIKSNAVQKNGVGGFVMIGLAYNLSKFVYGYEMSLGLDNTNIGKNENFELNLKSNIYLDGKFKVGYQFGEHYFNYLNFGIGVRDYKVSGFGVENSQFTPYYILGVGIEGKISERFNIFTEVNHTISMKGVETGICGAENLKVKSTRMKLGVKYYFGQNLFVLQS